MSMRARLGLVLMGLLGGATAHAQQIVVNEYFRDTTLQAAGTEWIEIVLRQDLTAAQLETFHVGDAQGARTSKVGSYRLTGMAAISANFRAGTIIVVSGGAAAPAVDTTYNPTAGDWNLSFRTNGTNITAVNNGGDLAGTDVVWVDTAATGATVAPNGFCVTYTSPAAGAFALTCQVAVAAPAAIGGTALLGDVTTEAAVAAQWSNVAAGSGTPGQANGATNTTSINTLRGQPIASIGTASVTEVDTGSVDMQVPVTLSAQPSVGFPVSVNFNTTLAGTATQGVDFTPTSGTLVFTNGGPLTQTINIPILGDTLDESNETIDVVLSSASNTTLGTTQGGGTIIDNDTSTPTINDVSEFEGDSGQNAFVFTVTLSVPADSTRSFHVYTTDGSAVAPSDYTAIPEAASTVINFAPGDTSEQVTVQVNGDTAVEADEGFTVSVALLPLGINRGNTVLDTGLGEILNDDVPTVTIGDVSQAEGSPSGTTTFTFTATLSSVQAQQSCNFSIETIAPGTANDATPGIDYVAETNLAVSIAPNTLSQTFSITVNQDTTVEADEIFDVGAFGEPFECDIANAGARGTILNDDVALPTLSIDDVSLVEGTGAGATTATFTVTLSAQPAAGAPVTVDYAGQSATATLGTDFSLTAGTLTFNNGGPLTQTIAVAITRDNIDEPDELYGVLLAGATNATIADAKGDGTIQDDDAAPMPSIADISGNEGNTGFTQFDFTVTLSNPSSASVSFEVFTQNGTAIAPGDYTALAPQIITFNPGQTSTTVPVQVLGDTVTEADESFALAVTQASSNIEGFPIIDTGTATLVNDDILSEISIDDVSLTEGTGAGSSVATFTVTISAQPAVAMPVTVNYATANSTALAGSDYTATSGTLTFTNGGPLTQTISVTLSRDNIDEGDESYFVNLSNPTSATIVDNQGLGTIVDDDGEPLPSVSEPSVTEGNTGTANATFIITLSNPSDSAITFQVFTTDGTAVAPGDYTAIPISPAAFVTFPALSTSQSVTVPVQGDVIVEANETFDLNLAESQPLVPDRGVPTIVASGTASIVNDDSASLSITGNSASEGNSGTTARTFTVTLSNPVQAPVSVNYSTADGTATVADNDYQAASGTVGFASLQTTAQTGNVLVVGDLEVEPDQSFAVNLSASGLPASVTLGNASANGTIVNDDSTAFSITGASGNEGTGSNTTLIFTVSLTAPAKNPVSVQYATVNGTAVAPGDYTATSGTLNFASGQQTATIPVTVIGENLVEPTESFTVTLSNPTGGATISTGSASGTIVNDDEATLSISDVTRAEGNGGGMTAFMFTITASAPSASLIMVNYATSAISATETVDYQSANATAMISPQALTTTVTVNVVADDLFEPTETFRVTLFGAIGAFIADGEGIGTIVGDDLPTAVPALDRGGLLLLMLVVAMLGAVAVRRER